MKALSNAGRLRRRCSFGQTRRGLEGQRATGQGGGGWQDQVRDPRYSESWTREPDTRGVAELGAVPRRVAAPSTVERSRTGYSGAAEQAVECKPYCVRTRDSAHVLTYTRRLLTLADVTN